jgi:hypothetical protein
MTPAEWFKKHGVHVFPTMNKVPAVSKGTSWKDYRCTREHAAGFREYGVPLGLLAVADSDTRAAEIWNAANLPDTPLTVTTGPYHDGSPGRGRHRYYRLVGDAPNFIHRDGQTIEFKHRGQYVVGPGSIRPDGVIYTADAWSWDLDGVPFFPVRDFCFDDGSCSITSPPGLPYEIPAALRTVSLRAAREVVCRRQGTGADMRHVVQPRTLPAAAGRGRCIRTLVRARVAPARPSVHVDKGA